MINNTPKRYFKNIPPNPDPAQLKQNKTPFIDPTFPPSEYSLTSKNPSGAYTDPLYGTLYENSLNLLYPKDAHKWKRVADIKQGQWKLFEGKIEFADVNQGSLGDCYFLSAITSLAKFPNILIEKFITQEYNEEGYYEVVLFIDGEWVIVYVDDYFPVDSTDSFVFAKPNGNELWAILLEKAWAKVNGGYSNIIGGNISEVLLALTGFASENIDNISLLSPISLYDKIQRSCNEGALIGCGSYTNGNGNELSPNGIVYSHNYSLIEAKDIKLKDIYLLKIRNPWGAVEWSGDWSDKSSKWTEEYKKYFDFEDKDDGIFWISIDDYIKNYIITSICHIFYGSKIRTYTIDYEEYFKYPLVFNMNLRKSGRIGINIINRNRRFNRDIPVAEDRPFSIMVFKYNKEEEIFEFYGNRGWFDNVESILDLTEGNYVIWIYLPYEFITLGQNYKYTVCFISNLDYITKYIGIDRDFTVIKELIIAHFKKTYQFEIASCREYIVSCPTDIHQSTNISPFVIYNGTANDIKFNFDFTGTTGYTNLYPYKDNKNFFIVVSPNSFDAVIRTRTGYENLTLGFNCTPTLNTDEEYFPVSVNMENFLRIDFEEDKKGDVNTIRSIRTNAYTFLDKSKAREIPIFMQEPAPILDLVIELTLDQIENIYPKEYEKLSNFIRDFPNNNTKYIQHEKDNGKYVGQINSKDEYEGNGIFMTNDCKTYIGQWFKSKPQGKGEVYDNEFNLMYTGDFLEGKAHGEGVYYYNKEEYYKGVVINNKIDGFGVYHFKNGDEWEGEFKDGKKNGIGIMNYSNGQQTVVEFSDDNFMGDSKMEEPEQFIETGLFRRSFKQSESHSVFAHSRTMFSSISIDSIEEDNLSKKPLRARAPNRTRHRKCMKSLLNPPIPKDMITFDIPAKKHSKESLDIPKFKICEPFMFWELFSMFPLLEIKTIKESVIGEKVKFLECKVESKSIQKTIGSYFDSENYYIGSFYGLTKKPNGYIRKYSKERRVLLEGEMGDNFKFSNGEGKLYFEDGYYKGEIFDEKPKGRGIYFFNNGNYLAGDFENEKNGTLRLYEKDTNTFYKVKYEDGEFKSKDKIVVNIPNKEGIAKITKCDGEKVLDYISRILSSPTEVYEDSVVSEKVISTGVYYGQMQKSGAVTGVGVLSNTGVDKKKIYIGELKNGKKNGRGFLLNEEFQLEYEGQFLEDQFDGYGILTTDKFTYEGQFSKDKQKGLGVKKFLACKDITCKGLFVNDMEYKITKINFDKGSYQYLEYQGGNLVNQSEVISTNSPDYMRKIYQSRISLKEKYSEYLEKYESLPKKYQKFNFIPGEKFSKDGLYVGELDRFGQRCGRGVLVNRKGEQFVGYFEDDKIVEGKN